MTTGEQNFFSRNGKPILVLVALWALLYLANLGGWDLWAPDEPRFGQVAREMIARGNPFVLYINNEIYTDKPPFYIWMIVLASHFTGGVTSFSTRLPSALGALVMMIVTYLMGCRLFGKNTQGRRASFLGAIALATTVGFFWQGRNAQLDMLLSAFILLSMYFWLRARQSVGRREIASYYLSWVFLALSVMTKGTGPLVVLPTLVAFYLLQKEGRALLRPRHILGFAVFAAILLAWYIPFYHLTPRAAAADMTWGQTWQRFTEAEHHVGPVWYYLTNWPPMALPWILFLPGAVWATTGARNRMDPMPRRLLYAWWLLTIIIFTLSKGKRDQYVLPMYPAVSLLIGYFLSEYCWTGTNRVWSFRAPLLGLGAIAMIAGVLAAVVHAVFFSRSLSWPGLYDYGATRMELSGLDLSGFSLLPTAAALVAGGALLLYFAGWALRPRAAISTLAITFALVYCSFIWVLLPAVNRYKSSREFCDQIDRVRNRGEAVATLELFREEYLMYGNYFIEVIPKKDGPEAIANFLKRPGRVFLMAREKDFTKREPRLQEEHVPYFVLYRERVGSRDMILISNRPNPALEGSI